MEPSTAERKRAMARRAEPDAAAGRARRGGVSGLRPGLRRGILGAMSARLVLEIDGKFYDLRVDADGGVSATPLPGREAPDRDSAVEVGPGALVRVAPEADGRSAEWREPDGPWRVEDAARYIDTHYAESFSLDWFVDKCAMNVTDFSRRFKAAAGCPLFEYINRQRVARACALLKSSDLPIIDVAEAVGYNNLSFFNRYFLRITGLSPRAFRAR